MLTFDGFFRWQGHLTILMHHWEDQNKSHGTDNGIHSESYRLQTVERIMGAYFIPKSYRRVKSKVLIFCIFTLYIIICCSIQTLEYDYIKFRWSSTDLLVSSITITFLIPDFSNKKSKLWHGIGMIFQNSIYTGKP